MPSCTALFVDRLAMTFGLTNESVRDAVTEWMQHGGRELYGFPVTSTRGGRYYSFSKKIEFDADRDVSLLVEYSPAACWRERDVVENTQDAEAEQDLDVYAVRDSRRPFRIEFNPARLMETPAYYQAFLSIMTLWFGDALHNEVSRARITRIDLAVDITGVSINSLLAARQDSTVMSTTYGRDGHIQTMYLGSKNSSERFVIYDKRAQRAAESDAPIAGRPRTRIEVRLKASLSLLDLRRYRNPFRHLGLRHIDDMLVASLGNSPHYWDWMVSASKQDGLQATLARIRNPRTRKGWRDRVFEREAPEWWNPDALWGGLGAALDAVGIFPAGRHVRRVRGRCELGS